MRDFVPMCMSEILIISNFHGIVYPSEIIAPYLVLVLLVIKYKYEGFCTNVCMTEFDYFQISWHCLSQ